MSYPCKFSPKRGKFVMFRVASTGRRAWAYCGVQDRLRVKRPEPDAQYSVPVSVWRSMVAADLGGVVKGNPLVNAWMAWR